MSSSLPSSPFTASPRVRRALRVASVGLVLGAACFVTPRDALAGDPPPSLTTQSEAQARFQTGLKYYDARDFESARLAFTQAYAVLQKPGILLNLALSELYTNRPASAINHLERYLAEPDLPADKRDRAKKAYEEAYKKTGHVALSVLPGTTLEVDGVGLAPPLPAVIHVAPGTRVLDATRGKGTKSVTVQAQAGEKTTADLRIDDEAAGPMPPIADAKGMATGTAAPTSPSSTGSTVSPSASASASDAGAPRSRGAWVPGVIGGGAVAGVGIALLVVSFVARSDEGAADDKIAALAGSVPNTPGGCIGSSSAACAELARTSQERVDAANRADTFLTLGVGLTAAGALTALGSWVLPKVFHSSTSAQLGPGPGLAGLSFTSNL